MSTPAQRYTAVAILLHWAIALALAGQIALGWWMWRALEEPAHRAQAFAAFQLHKSIGLTILVLSFVRLGWRLTHEPPPLPAHMATWEKLVARLSHWLFYAIIIIYPLTGWLYVSAGWSPFENHALDVPTFYFGLFHVPHLFELNHGTDASRSAWAHAALFAHEKLAWITIGLLVLHVGAALKHHVVDRDEVLTHMVPGMKPANPAIERAPASRGRGATLAAGFAMIALSAGALIYTFMTPPAQHAPAAPIAETTTAALAVAPAAPAATVATTPATAATPAGPPPAWRVDQAQSGIAFMSSVQGVDFSGSFSRWNADIRFDPNSLARSRAEVTIQTNSIVTGDAQRDAALPTQEWFDAAGHPTATFRTTSIVSRGGDRYEARGALTLKGDSTPVTLPFRLTIEGDRADMRGQISLDRLALNLGKASFPDDTSVARTATVSIHVVATRAP